MKSISLTVLALLIASNARAQHFEPPQPAGKENGALFAIPRGVAREVAATARDLATSRDRQWQILTFAQIGAATADVQTTLYNFRHCAGCQEIGISRLIVGSHPDAHKYIIAGAVEITVEAVAAHYLRHHGPIRKWYWRSVWMLPQSISLYGHTRSTIRNIGVRSGCDPASQHCF